ncbi:MAG: zinc ribbon domain-containing protein [Halalkalicoccus sp.]
MSKITFRADEDLVAGIEAMDASKSEVMREALRAYLRSAPEPAAHDERSLDALVRDRIDERIDERLSTDVNVTVRVEDERIREHDAPAQTASDATDATSDHRCEQCGEDLEEEHVFCPNCGEKTVSPTCDCGLELRSDWAFCPGCGRRTPAADVLDR